MILQASHLKKAFLEDVVVEDATFHVEEGEHAALIGRNGAGKTTLFRMLAGEFEPDGGEVFLKKDASVGYLRQESDLQSGRSVFEEVLSVKQDVFDLEEAIHALEHKIASENAPEPADLDRYARLQDEFEKKNGYAIQSEITGILKGLGFPEERFAQPVFALSGGEKTQVALSKLLLSKPDVLLLDEPTNHLDLKAVTWLETFLSSYPKAVIVVSHDRYFLDRTVTKVIEIENGRTRSFFGNYTAFAEKKKAVVEAEKKAYENKQREIRHQEEVIETLKSYNREKSIKRAESREKLLAKMDRPEKPFEDTSKIRFTLEAGRLSGKDVLSVNALSKAFGEKRLFSEVSFEVRRGEKLTLIGGNGTGKTTLLRILNEEVSADGGTFRFGANVTVGYYDQEHRTLSPGKTVFDEFHDAYPTMTETEVRNLLAAFLFLGDDVFKQVKTLSGGEKSRLALAKLMCSKANLLLLDEPTNHLDVDGREALEEALRNYPGTVFSVSHDRYFMNAVSNRILELYHAKILNYEGNYDDYAEKAEQFHLLSDGRDQAGGTHEKPLSEGKKQHLEAKEAEAARRKHENRVKALEEGIEIAAEAIKAVEAELLLPEYATDAEKLLELTEKKEALEREQEALYEEWAEIVG